MAGCLRRSVLSTRPRWCSRAWPRRRRCHTRGHDCDARAQHHAERVRAVDLAGFRDLTELTRDSREQVRPFIQAAASTLATVKRART